MVNGAAGMPRIFHVADTHLGFQAYHRVTTEGLNQREVDFQEAFRRVVDAAVEERPDVFLHAGDLFDHPRPTNRAISFALTQMRRLSEARIPTVLVSGNHDTPRMRETGHIFRVFEGLPHVHAVYDGPRSVAVGGVLVHAAPQAVTQEAFQAQLASLEPHGPEPQVLLVHGTVLGVEGLFTSEFNEYQIPLGALRPEFDYVALGHFHNARRIAPNAHYAGSTEYCSFSEAGESKGWLDVELGRGTLEARRRPTQARTMTDLGALDGHALAFEALVEEARRRLESAPEAALLRLTLDRLPRDAARPVDWNALRSLRRDAVHLELRVQLEDNVAHIDGPVELGPLAQEFDRFLAKRPLEGVSRDAVRAAASRYLNSQEGSARAA